MLKLRLAAVASLLAPLALAHQHQSVPSDRASVLLFDAAGSSTGASSSSSHSSDVKTYNAPQANAIISSFLNIEEYERLPDGLQVPEQIVLAAASSYGEQQERAQSLMILAEKLGHDGSVDDYISSSTLAARSHHQLQVGNSPDSHTWLSLLSRYTERLGEKFGLVQPSTDSGSDNVKRFLLPGTLNGEYAVDASMQDEVYATYLNSLAELASTEQSGKSHVRLAGLREIAHRFGPKSEEFTKAKEMMRLSVDSVIASHPGKLAFFLVPGRHTQGPGHKHLRAASSADIFSTYNRHERAHRHRQSKRQTQSPSDAVSPLVPTTSQCFASEDVCSNSTNSCSGHGSCVQGKKSGVAAMKGDVDAECWVCKCQNGEDGNGRMRYYSGQFCQKEDRSSQFFLLAGSTLLLLLVTVSSVGLLSKVGAEPLPSTLAAMGGGHGGHAKRD